MAHTSTMTLLLTDATSAVAATNTLAERARLAYTNQAAEVSDATSAATTTTITPKIMPAVTQEVIATIYRESDEEKEQQNPDNTNFNNPKVWKSMGHSNPKKAAKELGPKFIKNFCEQIALNIPSDKTPKEKCKWLTWELKNRKMLWNGEMITVIKRNWNLPQNLFQWFQKKLNSYCKRDQFPKYPCTKIARKKNYYNRVNYSGSRGLQSRPSFGHTQHQDSSHYRGGGHKNIDSTQLMDNNIYLFSATLYAYVQFKKISSEDAQKIMTESMMSYSMRNMRDDMSTNTNSMDTSSQGDNGNNRRKSIKSHKTSKTPKNPKNKKHYDSVNHY